MRRRWRAVRGPLVVTTLALSIAGLLVVGWLAARVVRAVDHLEAAQQLQRTAQVALTSGSAAQARGVEQQLAAQARGAAAASDDPVWALAAHVPVAGRPLRTLRVAARSLDTLSTQVLPVLTDLTADLPRLRGADGSYDVAPVAARRAALERAAAVSAQVADDVAASPPAFPARLTAGRLQLLQRSRQLHSGLTALVTVARAGPAMLGTDGRPRRYLFVVQNNAEARALGGIVGAYGIITADRGRVRLTTIGPDSDLLPASAPVSVVSAEFQRRYGNFDVDRDWRNVTMTPDLPTSASLMLGLWADTHGGDRLDGVVSVDDVGLALGLQAAGPIRSADGTVVTGANFVDYSLRQVYARYPDKAQRSAVLTDLAKRAFDRVTTGQVPVRRLAERLGRATVTGHLGLYSADKSVQADLAGTPIVHALPRHGEPYLMVVSQDVGASKLSPYVRRTISYSGRLSTDLVDLGHGPVPVEQASVAVTLTNTAPRAGLPDYVTLREDLGPARPSPVGQIKLWLSVYVGADGILDDALLDGRRVAMSTGTDEGLSVFSTTLSVDPGASRTLRLVVRQPTRPGAPLVYQQQPVTVADLVSLQQSADARTVLSYRGPDPAS